MPLQRQHIQFQNEYFNHYYLCNYQPRYTGEDKLSESLIRFKDCNELDVRAWAECAVMKLQDLFFQENLVIVRALGKEEIKVLPDSKTSLDLLGALLSEKLDCHYRPELLSKTRETKSMKLLSKTEREVELENAYIFKTESNIDEILIIDDILTTGTTMKEIIRAIRKVLPTCKITLFTLADTDHQALLNKDLSLSDYSLKWSQREWEFVADADISYNELEILKQKILNNAF